MAFVDIEATSVGEASVHPPPPGAPERGALFPGDKMKENMVPHTRTEIRRASE